MNRGGYSLSGSRTRHKQQQANQMVFLMAPQTKKKKLRKKRVKGFFDHYKYNPRAQNRLKAAQLMQNVLQQQLELKQNARRRQQNEDELNWYLSRVVELENDQDCISRRQKAMYPDEEDEAPVLSRMTSFSEFYNLEEGDSDESVKRKAKKSPSKVTFDLRESQSVKGHSPAKPVKVSHISNIPPQPQFRKYTKSGDYKVAEGWRRQKAREASATKGAYILYHPVKSNRQDNSPTKVNKQLEPLECLFPLQQTKEEKEDERKFKAKVLATFDRKKQEMIRKEVLTFRLLPGDQQFRPNIGLLAKQEARKSRPQTSDFMKKLQQSKKDRIEEKLQEKSEERPSLPVYMNRSENIVVAKQMIRPQSHYNRLNQRYKLSSQKSFSKGSNRELSFDATSFEESFGLQRLNEIKSAIEMDQLVIDSKRNLDETSQPSASILIRQQSIEDKTPLRSPKRSPRRSPLKSARKKAKTNSGLIGTYDTTSWMPSEGTGFGTATTVTAKIPAKEEPGKPGVYQNLIYKQGSYHTASLKGNISKNQRSKRSSRNPNMYLKNSFRDNGSSLTSVARPTSATYEIGSLSTATLKQRPTTAARSVNRAVSSFPKSRPVKPSVKLNSKLEQLLKSFQHDKQYSSTVATPRKTQEAPRLTNLQVTCQQRPRRDFKRKNNVQLKNYSQLVLDRSGLSSASNFKKPAKSVSNQTELTIPETGKVLVKNRQLQMMKPVLSSKNRSRRPASNSSRFNRVQNVQIRNQYVCQSQPQVSKRSKKASSTFDLELTK